MARKTKAHISMREKLASALAHMMVEVDGKLERAIPYDDAKRMTSQEVCSLFQFDHGIHEAIDGPTEHWNLTPRLIAEHRRKTAKVDRPRIAKTGRNEEAHNSFRRKMLAKAGQSDAPHVAETSTKPKRKIKSRGFQKRPDGHQYKWGKRG